MDLEEESRHYPVSDRPGGSSAATIGPSLSAKVAGLTDSASAGTVIVAFNTNNGLNASHFSVLRWRASTRVSLCSISEWWLFRRPRVKSGLASNAAVRSVWQNDRLNISTIKLES